MGRDQNSGDLVNTNQRITVRDQRNILQAWAEGIGWVDLAVVKAGPGTTIHWNYLTTSIFGPRSTIQYGKPWTDHVRNKRMIRTRS